MSINFKTNKYQAIKSVFFIAEENRMADCDTPIFKEESQHPISAIVNRYKRLFLVTFLG